MSGPENSVRRPWRPRQPRQPMNGRRFALADAPMLGEMQTEDVRIRCSSIAEKSLPHQIDR